jgi:hypothetical protein
LIKKLNFDNYGRADENYVVQKKFDFLGNFFKYRLLAWSGCQTEKLWLSGSLNFKLYYDGI